MASPSCELRLAMTTFSVEVNNIPFGLSKRVRLLFDWDQVLLEQLLTADTKGA